MRIIRGKYGRRRFDVPTNITARPTTDFARENIFNVLDGYIDFEGLTALDLFAGTGAVSIELLSRGCASVTSVEKASVQYRFIQRLKGILDDPAWHPVKGDVLRFIATASHSVDFIFADPPYDMPGFAEIPLRVIASPLFSDGTLFVLEHSKAHDFSHIPEFVEHRAYGSVNFSIFRRESDGDSGADSADNDQVDQVADSRAGGISLF